jgi:hypothetical protein
MKYTSTTKCLCFKDISTVMEAQMKTSGALPQVEIDSLDIQGHKIIKRKNGKQR